jgi:hypothetical protein
MKRLLSSLFVLTLLLTACGSPSAPTAVPIAPKVPAAAPTTAPAATTAPVAPAAATAVPTTAPVIPSNAKDAVIAALQAQLKAGPYRTKTTVTSENGTTTLTGELIPPDKLHSTLKTDKIEMESVFISDKGWIKQNGQWKVSPVSGAAALEQAFAAQLAERLSSSISDAAAVGDDTVNGEPARVYTYISTTDVGAKVVSAVKLWVNANSGLPVKAAIAGEAMGVKSTSVQTIEYDNSITIVPPM